jgi:hypothetical protein
MNDLRNFFVMLCRYERQRAVELVAPWRPREVSRVTRAFRIAAKKCRFGTMPIPSRTSPPSLGHRVAESFAERLNRWLRGYAIEHLPGNGYPDKALLRRSSPRLSCAMEIKAKSRWDREDWRRCVLTSSSRKLRRHFARKPPCHLLVTLIYNRRGNTVRLRRLRLDFLAPQSAVETRYEASVSQHHLSRGKHPFKVLHLT